MTTDTKPAGEIVMHPRSGEIIDVRHAQHEQLAECVEQIDALRTELAEIQQIVLDELLRRLDRKGQWTMRVGDPDAGVQWEIKAPSPTAGTTTYDVDELRDGLRELVPDVIDEDAASGALDRQVHISARVPIAADLKALEAKLRGLEGIAGVPVRDVTVNTAEAPKSGGIARLEKMGGQAAELARAVQRHKPPPPRHAKVTAKHAKRS